jgi:hypothetical protein
MSHGQHINRLTTWAMKLLTDLKKEGHERLFQTRATVPARLCCVLLFRQTFTTTLIDRIRTAAPSVTRSALSRRVCDWLDWHSATGKPQGAAAPKRR